MRTYAALVDAARAAMEHFATVRAERVPAVYRIMDTVRFANVCMYCLVSCWVVTRHGPLWSTRAAVRTKKVPVVNTVGNATSARIPPLLVG